MKTKIPKKQKGHKNVDTAMNTVAYFPDDFANDQVTGQDATAFTPPYPLCGQIASYDPAFTTGINEDGDTYISADVEGDSVLHLTGANGAYDAEGIPFIGSRPPRRPA